MAALKALGLSDDSVTALADLADEQLAGVGALDSVTVEAALLDARSRPTWGSRQGAGGHPRVRGGQPCAG